MPDWLQQLAEEGLKAKAGDDDAGSPLTAGENGGDGGGPPPCSGGEHRHLGRH